MFRFSVLALSCLLPICAWSVSLDSISSQLAKISCDRYDETASYVHNINAKKLSQQHTFSYPSREKHGNYHPLKLSKEHYEKLISDHLPVLLSF